MISPRGGDFYLATSGDYNLAVDTVLTRTNQIGAHTEIRHGAGAGLIP
jgi:hypothetical protein